MCLLLCLLGYVISWLLGLNKGERVSLSMISRELLKPTVSEKRRTLGRLSIRNFFVDVRINHLKSF